MKKFNLIVVIYFLCLTQFCYARITGGYYENLSQKELTMEGEKGGIRVQSRGDCSFFLLVDNRGSEPVEFNYSIDKCFYITMDDKKYLLPFTNGNEPYYGDDMAVLNPDSRTTMAFDREGEEFDDFCSKFEDGKIKEILLEINYGKIKVRLLPVRK